LLCPAAFVVVEGSSRWYLYLQLAYAWHMLVSLKLRTRYSSWPIIIWYTICHI
jgi:hypothetical protein